MVLKIYMLSWINLQKLICKAEKILRYLHGTSKLKIVLRNQENRVLLGESDATWGGDQNDVFWNMASTVVPSRGK